MTLVLDAAPLVALADRADPLQGRVEAALRDEPGDLVIPAPVCAEVDYLLGTRLGRAARVAFLDDLAAGRLGTRRVMTFDERHFRTLRSLKGPPFTLLPADDPAR